MFTGIIQALGTLEINPPDRVVINWSLDMEVIGVDLAIGDSVAVDGICLTVETILSNGFTATASSETLDKTTLPYRSQSEYLVNLESSLRVGSKIGGHFVSGHIDGIAELWDLTINSNSWEMKFGFAMDKKLEWIERIVPYLVIKGSIAVNGVSLTIANCDDQGDWFTVVIIPHSFSNTNLSSLQPGDLVNIETDLLGKYVRKMVHFPYSPQLSIDFLTEHGYL